MGETMEQRWQGVRAEVRERLETRDYGCGQLSERLGTCGAGAGEVMRGREELSQVWIPGVEIFARQVYQQKGRGYFAELARLNDGVLQRIGLAPQQWAAALMHRNSAKGFHIHPPHVPQDMAAADWFRGLFAGAVEDVSRRPYALEQWDVMFFLTSICEMILIDEREGMPRRVMRFTLTGDSKAGVDHAAVVIPPGVAHALRNIGNEDLIMVYGTSTAFNPAWEGRIASGIEADPLPPDWTDYLQADGPS